MSDRLRAPAAPPDQIAVESMLVALRDPSRDMPMRPFAVGIVVAADLTIFTCVFDPCGEARRKRRACGNIEVRSGGGTRHESWTSWLQLDNTLRTSESSTTMPPFTVHHLAGHPSHHQ